MTDQNQAPERIWARPQEPGDDYGNWGLQREPVDVEFIRKDLHDAAIKQRAEKAEAERDQALAASAAREIAMRDRAYDKVKIHMFGRNKQYGDRMLASIAALPLSPDGQQALDDVRAEAWDDGYSACDRDNHTDRPITLNPYAAPDEGGEK